MPLTAPVVTLRSANPVFLVDDITATMNWYRTNLGFETDAVPKTPPHTFAMLRRDDVAIFLQQLDGYQRPNHYEEREGGVWSAYIRTEGLHTLYEALRSLPDVRIIRPLSRQPYGETEFEIRDPNGYVLVFAERHATTNPRNTD
jgi:uncharacterized glyoxalase superfamily protein PhnB